MPNPTLPPYIQFRYGYFDGTKVLQALPIKCTDHSQTMDMLVINQDGTTSVASGVRHISSGDAKWWSDADPNVGNMFHTS